LPVRWRERLARTGKVIGAPWDEFDLVKGIWTILAG
jgi:hypothetical protein